MPLITVKNVWKSFGSKTILHGISMDIHDGETVSVLGKSGVGKSVLLKLIVGLLNPDQGEIYYRGQNIHLLSEHDLNQVRSEMGFLFQAGALFDSMTVGENMNLILQRHTNLRLDERIARIQKALELVGLSDKIDEMPASLSGGQRKRAALARSIVLKPKVIFYDEPTTGLDPITASSIAELILLLQLELNVASIAVTHDLPTAYTISDRVIVLESGSIIFDGKVEDLGSSPNPHLNEFLDSAKLNREHRNTLLQKHKKIEV